MLSQVGPILRASSMAAGPALRCWMLLGRVTGICWLAPDFQCRPTSSWVRSLGEGVMVTSASRVRATSRFSGSQARKARSARLAA
jgi:hypothetical protein